MSAMDISLWITCICLAGCVISLDMRLRKMEKVRKEMYKQMASPEKIEQDMEASANYVENVMLAPKRTTAPRNDQQRQHAVIHRPKQIGPKVGFPRKKY